MTHECESVRDLLADHGPDAVAQDGVSDHLASCDACSDVLAALGEVDAGLAAFSLVEAPDALLQATLAHINADAQPKASLGLLAIVRVAFAAVFGGLGQVAHLLVWPLRWLTQSRGRRIAGVASGFAVIAAAGVVTLTSSDAGFFATVSEQVRTAGAVVSDVGPFPGDTPATAGEWSSEDGPAARSSTSRFGVEVRAEEEVSELGVLGLRGATAAEQQPQAVRQRAQATALGWGYGFQSLGHQPSADEGRRFEVTISNQDETLPRQAEDDWHGIAEGERDRRDRGIETGLSQGLHDVAGLSGFLAERNQVSGLTFQQARGYWANTYVPGDPRLQVLKQRLASAGAAHLGDSGLSALELAEQAVESRQPFDAPRRSALGLYLHADQREINGESRVLLQVGIRGSARRAGRRPAVNVGVVLDLRRALSANEQARVRGLLEALSRARDTGDRMSLSVAGPRGGLVIPTGELRHGQVEVAMRRLFGERDDAASEMSLEQAMRAAVAAVGAADDPTSPLGSSLVLLVTPGATGPGPATVGIAHVGALAGIATSVVGVGDAGDPLSFESVVLAGQGRRRVLGAPADATRAVREELAAVGRVVARAIRLRVRLAPGVRLVQVLGSHRLGDVETTRVRAQEQASDIELARRLGIQADRGQDEDGIQIVIPAFYADDSHIILLDVVAAGPGPVADVHARFKDLVHLRNGSADATLALARGERAPGRLEQNVVSNLLTHRLTEALERAADAAHRGDGEAARASLLDNRLLVESAQGDMAGLARDRRLESNLNLIRQYTEALADPAPNGASAAAVADSLRYAAGLL